MISIIPTELFWLAGAFIMLMAMVSLNLADTWQSGEGSLDGVLTPFAVHPL